MLMKLNHTIVPARNKQEAARFFADIFGLAVGSENPGTTTGRFAVVQAGGVNFAFDDAEAITPQHYAFHVNDEEFDDILARIRQRDITIAADPRHEREGELNENEGGRGFYFCTPDGHNIELLTRI